MKRKIIRYYSDEINDDFGGKHSRPNVYGTYKFERKGFDDFICKVFTFAIAVPLVWILTRFHGINEKNKKNLKAIKRYKGGFFMYANHAGTLDVIENTILSAPKRVNHVGFSDPLTIPVAKHLVRALGYIPLPEDIHDYKKYEEVMWDYAKNQNEIICFYPEAHIWPGFTGVRNFKSVSFRYPAKFNMPAVPVFCMRRKKRGIFKFMLGNPFDVYIGPMFFPKEELSMKENEIYLRDCCYNWMKNIVDNHPGESNIEYVYIPKEYNVNLNKEKKK